MSQHYPLDPVIRVADADEQVNPASEKKVAVEMRPNRDAPDPWWRRRWFKGEVKYFIVSTGSRSVADGKLSVFYLKDADEDFTVALSGTYTVRCERGQEERAAAALRDGNHPSLELERLIRDWVEEYKDGEQHGGKLDSFIAAYLKDKRSLQGFLRERASQEAGLRLDVRLKVEAEGALDTIKIGPTNMPILVGGFGQEQNLKITLHLYVDEENKVAAILHHYRSQPSKDAVVRQVRDYFARRVSLQDFLTRLNRDGIRGGLTEKLNEFLAPYGRKVGALSLESTNPPPPPTFRDDILVTCNIQNYGEIFVSNTAELSLIDAARYQDHQSPDLKKWLEATLERVISTELFYAKYLDVIIGFLPFEQNIKKRLGEEAEAIGYRMDHLITLPDLKPIKWREPFALEPPPEAEFETSDARVRVKLRIHVTVQIPDLNKVADYINQQQDVPKLMREAVVSRTRRYLHRIDPQRYYIRFTDTDVEDETPVVEELRNEIKAELQGFSPKIIEIEPVRLDTEINLRLMQLMEATCPFKIEVTPFQGAENVIIKGKFQVDGVMSDGWYKFQLRKYDLSDIRESLQDFIRSRLNTRAFRELRYGLEEELYRLEDQIKQLARQCASEMFGLAVSLFMIDRDKTVVEQEKAAFLVNRVMRVIESYRGLDDSKVEILQRLLDKRANAATQAGNEAEVEEYDQKIEAILSDLTSQKMPAIGSVERRVLLDAEASEGDADEDTDDKATV